MSIKLPAGLPVRHVLEAEGVDLIDAMDFRHGATRPLRIGLLNLMPKKVETEAQIARLLGMSPHPVELTLFIPDSYLPKTAPERHIRAFYQRWSQIRERRFDGLVVTGAPVETMPFDQVTYWRELTDILDWTQSNVHRTLYICWAAQAALHHFHGVPKHALDEKVFGVFSHRVIRPDSPLLDGFDREFPVPVSRHTEVRAADLPVAAGLEILAESPETGLCLIEDRPRRALYMFNHLEYDAGVLRDEFLRDRESGVAVPLPRNYFPGDDPRHTPVNDWRTHGKLLFGNWIEEISLSARSTDPFVAVNEHMMEWLFGGSRLFRVVGHESTDLLLLCRNDLNTLPNLLRKLAGFGVSPRKAKVITREDGTAFVELRFDRLEGPILHAISQAVLDNAETVRMAYRNAGSAGGIFVRHTPAATADAGSESGVPSYSAIA